MFPPRVSGIAAFGAVVLLLASCAGEQQQTGGIDELTIAVPGTVTAAQQAFLDRFDELSEGTITVEVLENWQPSGGDASTEDALTQAVAAGEVDIAWVTVRSFSSLGLTDIDALEAPMLVQTHDQQRAIATGLAGEIILKQLRYTEIEGLALLPGPTQYPLSLNTPIVAVEDWAGKTIEYASGSNKESSEAAAIEALGGTPTADGTDPLADVLAGTVQGATASPYDLAPAAVEGATTSAEPTATGAVMTSNLALWPQMSAIVINRDVLDRLSTRQNGFIDASVERAQDIAMATPADGTAVKAGCAAGARYGKASADQIAATLEAVQPVYEALAADPEEAELLEAIQDAVKSNVGAGAFGIPSGCAWAAPAG